MTVEYKTLPAFTKAIEGRTVTGIFAVHGNVDDGGDMSVPGSFAKYLNTGRKRTRFLWQHDSSNPPIASINSIREVGRQDLPGKVLEYAPNATGGVEVSRTYYEGIPLADWVLAGIRAGDIDEMSYAYNAKDIDRATVDEMPVRMLLGIELADVSDVLWGLNNATLAGKNFYNLNPLVSGELSFIQHSDAVVSTVEEYLRRAKDKTLFRQKEGRVLSGANRERLSRLITLMQEAAADMQGLMEDSAPKPADDPDEMGKSAEPLKLFAEYQQTLARINGVRFANPYLQGT